MTITDPYDAAVRTIHDRVPDEALRQVLLEHVADHRVRRVTGTAKLAAAEERGKYPSEAYCRECGDCDRSACLALAIAMAGGWPVPELGWEAN